MPAPYPYYVPPTGYPPYPYGAWPYPAPPQHWMLPANSGPHPVLSTTPAVMPYNVELHPREAIPKAYQTVGTHPMLPHSAPNRIQVISKAFPWTIEIQGIQAVTCKDLWKSLYHHLQQPITDVDWAHIVRDESLRRAVRKAYEKRVKPEHRSSSPMRRIDYLGNYTLFIGLEKDDAYVQNTLIPGAKKVQETWVARFMKST